ncbi:hypothetical protein J8273_7187 [Carpediemonas membranifera]|uniref:Uncharacterized protein n=1 Tax=Carpediemonas membranifera TaxID=201153 RepID=A0A8J6AS46_9EUKA|nr:hypothetical protein J8273_7187 [Carpediemonas membranifera]|eukprot:KAG9390920.1 hypothetical protein J8273_7187 [Carpediemonas membranifera]
MRKTERSWKRRWNTRASPSMTWYGERVYDEICGTRRVRARKDNAPCPGEDHADHVLQRYLWADQIDTQALTGEKTLTTRLPAEARVVRRVTASLISAQKTEIQSLKEQVERLKKQVTDERRDHFLECRRIHHEHDVGYLASCDVSFAASPIPPQSGTLSRTSCPRRATNEPEASMSVKRKALFITPEKARPEDSEEESEEEETEEEQEEAKEKRGEAEEETVNTCDACIQTEPETQTRITSEAAVQTCINVEALTTNCTAIHVKSDGNCVAYCLQAIELGGRVDGDFEKWQRGLCQSVKAKYWSKKNVTERSLTDPDSGYYNSNAIRVWARKQKRNILVVQSYDGYNGMQGISAILYLFDGTTMLAPDADLWGLTDNFAIVIEGNPAHATLYQKKEKAETEKKEDKEADEEEPDTVVRGPEDDDNMSVVSISDNEHEPELVFDVQTAIDRILTCPAKEIHRDGACIAHSLNDIKHGQVLEHTEESMAKKAEGQVRGTWWDPSELFNGQGWLTSTAISAWTHLEKEKVMVLQRREEEDGRIVNSATVYDNGRVYPQDFRSLTQLSDAIRETGHEKVIVITGNHATVYLVAELLSDGTGEESVPKTRKGRK